MVEITTEKDRHYNYHDDHRYFKLKTFIIELFIDKLFSEK